MKQLTLSQVKKLLPRRLSHQNKSAGGRTLIIAGSKDTFGAAVLAATAAARVGSGYTYLLTDLREFSIFKNPDFLVYDIKKINQIDFRKFDSIAIGPGLGCTRSTTNIIRRLKKENISNVVVDADAITMIAKEKIFPLPSSWIMTPHSGEFLRLVEALSFEKQKKSLTLLQKTQRAYGCSILLKGESTLICSNSKLVMMKSGNSALAKAGTGDVLTGMIAGFIAQGLPAFSAACLASFIHGRMAKIWVKNKNDHLSLLASDLNRMLPKTIFNLRKNR